MHEYCGRCAELTQRTSEDVGARELRDLARRCRVELFHMHMHVSRTRPSDFARSPTGTDERMNVSIKRLRCTHLMHCHQVRFSSPHARLPNYGIACTKSCCALVSEQRASRSGHDFVLRIPSSFFNYERHYGKSTCQSHLPQVRGELGIKTRIT